MWLHMSQCNIKNKARRSESRKGTEPFSFLVVTAVRYNMGMRLIFNPGREPQ